MPAKGSTTRVPRTCEQCGLSFDALPSKVAAGKARFCSKGCADMAAGRIDDGFVCEECGVSFMRKPSRNRGPRHFCSRKCYGLAITKRPMDRTHNGKPVRRTKAGYITVWQPEHPQSGQTGYIYEHRLVVESVIGRSLLTTEHVHHINGVTDDNRPENLEVLDARTHGRISAHARWSAASQSS